MNKITERDQLDKLVEIKVHEALQRRKNLLSGHFKAVIRLMTDSFAIVISTYFYFAHILNIFNSLLSNSSNIILDSRGYDFLIFLSYLTIVITILKTINVKYREYLKFPIYYNIFISIVFSLSYNTFSEINYSNLLRFTYLIFLSALLVTFALDYYFKTKNKLQLIENFTKNNKYFLSALIAFIIIILTISYNYLKIYLKISITFLDEHPWLFTGLLFIITLYLFLERRLQKHD